MPVITSTITLSATPQQLGSGNPRRQQLRVHVPSGTMYVGDSAVTSSTGQPFASTDAEFDVFQAHDEDKTPCMSYYAVGSGEVVRVMEVLAG